jgi:c-di-GMP-binding flagellar brake protein YcgR
MPANRSRTFQWRRCLKQVQERQGALEIAVAPAPGDSAAHTSPQLVWRVRLISLTDREIVVEQPTALGRTIDFHPGVELAVTFSIGQNRWSFTTTVQNALRLAHESPSGKKFEQHILRLNMPESVQRCQRRQHERLESEGSSNAANAAVMPTVEIWPLLDPKSVVLAERTSELRAHQHSQTQHGTIASGGNDHATDFAMPEVGPKFHASLVNLGGGGVGLRIKPNNSQAVTRHKLFWMRISLSPHTAEPICATCKLVHTHMESNHDVYAGLAFDFSFNPSHQKFVVDQICRFVEQQQALQQESSRTNKRVA